MTLLLCTTSVALPPAVARAQPAGPAAPPAVVDPAIVDAALAADGALTIRVVDAARNPLTDQQVTVFADGAVVAAALTDESGAITVSGLRDGLHEIEACSKKLCVRLWDAAVAPPHAESVVCIACSDDAYCAPCDPPQPRRGPLKRAFAKYPIATAALIGAGIGAAIGIPIAVSQKPASP
jgi:hypothetical protein